MWEHFIGFFGNETLLASTSFLVLSSLSVLAAWPVLAFSVAGSQLHLHLWFCVSALFLSLKQCEIELALRKKILESTYHLQSCNL